LLAAVFHRSVPAFLRYKHPHDHNPDFGVICDVDIDVWYCDRVDVDEHHHDM
jgi:hypothetical protein